MFPYLPNQFLVDYKKKSLVMMQKTNDGGLLSMNEDLFDDFIKHQRFQD